MKKFFSVFMIAVCCMALAMPAQAQLIKFGVKGGVNLSKLKFEGMKDNSTGVDGALLYSQKGDKMEGLDMKQSGLDIPVNLKYSIGLGSMLGIYVAAGPDFFFNFKGDKNFEDGRKLESKKAQVGINVGAGVKLVRHLQIGFNYTIPCGDSFTWKSASEAIGTKNKTWQISAAYLF